MQKLYRISTYLKALNWGSFKICDMSYNSVILGPFILGKYSRRFGASASTNVTILYIDYIMRCVECKLLIWSVLTLVFPPVLSIVFVWTLDMSHSCLLHGHTVGISAVSSDYWRLLILQTPWIRVSGSWVLPAYLRETVKFALNTGFTCSFSGLP